jgi:general secretion pathway protein G
MILPGQRKAVPRRRKIRGGRDPDREPAGRALPDALARGGLRRMLFVMAALGVIGGMLISESKKPTPSGKRRSRDAIAAREMTVLTVALGRFRADCGRYPTNGEGLLALITNPGAKGWAGPYVSLIHRDPWHRPYIYECDGTAMRLLSRGPDGSAGTTDDVLPPGIQP